jgi:hypothetical protein
MKKIVFILSAALCFMLANAESMVAFGTAIAKATITSAPRDEADQTNRSEADASDPSRCKEEDVSLDEGYGVSRHEKRLICREIR